MTTQQVLTDYLELQLQVLPVKVNNDEVKPLFTEWQTTKVVNKNNLSNYLYANSWGIITGKLSNNLEAIDFDEKYEKGIFRKWFDILPNESKKLVNSLPLSKTKSGGFHLLYRCSIIDGNEKLAETENNKVMIETRGIGGFVFEFPTVNYKWLQPISLLKEITKEERAVFINTARFLNRKNNEIKTNKLSQHSTEDNIFNEFNNKNSWGDILIPLGWRKTGHNGQEIFWTRPGKDGKAVSATENYKGLGLFHVFSTSTDLNNRSYNKFQIYCHYEHNDNTSQAVKALMSKGYGKMKIKEIKTESSKPVVIDQKNIITFLNAAEIEAKPIEWFWKDKIAKGKVSLLAGDPGLGKSQITLSIASIVSNGDYFPLGNKSEQGKVLIVSAEDTPNDTIIPRLIAMNAKLENILLLGIVKKEGKEKYFDMEDDLPLLEETLKQQPDVKMIIIDPISAFLGKTDSHVNAEVRKLLMALSKLAEKTRISILIVTHLNKGMGNNPTNRVSGSLAFVAAVRSAFMVIKDESDDQRRLFSTIKTNIAADNSCLAYRVEKAIINGLIETSKIVWEREEIKMSASDILKRQINEAGSVDRKTIEWLENYVAKFPDGIESRELENAALRQGISRRTLFRAQKEAMVETVPTGDRNTKRWRSVNYQSNEINSNDIPI